MAEKDFLGQFSNANKKPDSFKEEERIPVHKEKKPVNVKAVIIAAVSLVIVLAACYFIFLAPKIEMPDFAGKTKKDVTAWVKQQGIETSGIIFNEEYDFETEAETILEQDVTAGKKVKENVKITFTVSKGADPDELIKVPDLKTMEKTDIQEWVSKNKLTKTKVSTAYSETVEENKVISVEFSGCDEDTFTRSSTLKIQISKGSAPAGTVAMEDFKDKTYAYVETWAKSKKIELKKVEQFSKTVAADLIIAQSVESGKTLKEGETLTVTVSLGEGVVIPDFNSMSRSDVDEWLNKYGISPKSKYSNSSSYIVEQSIASGKTVSVADLADMKVTKNLGSSFYLNEFLGQNSAVGLYINELNDICNAKRSTGIDAYAGSWGNEKEEYSYKYSKGQIVSVTYSSHSTGKKYSESDRMPLDLRFNVTLSKGLITKLDLADAKVSPATSVDVFMKTKIIDVLASKGISFSNETDSNANCSLEIGGYIVTQDEFEYYEGQSVRLINE